VRRFLKIFGIVTFLGSLAAGAYFLARLRSRRPQVELYFDDGSMLALAGNAPEAAPFVSHAAEILKASPVTR